MGRGSSLPTRGRGIFTRGGRGGASQIHTGMGHSTVQQSQQASPTRIMNPGAKQFVPPGSKRSHEGGDGEGDKGKRIRGNEGGDGAVGES